MGLGSYGVERPAAAKAAEASTLLLESPVSAVAESEHTAGAVRVRRAGPTPDGAKASAPVSAARARMPAVLYIFGFECGSHASGRLLYE